MLAVIFVLDFFLFSRLLRLLCLFNSPPPFFFPNMFYSGNVVLLTAKTTLPIPTSVYSIFMCPDNAMAASVCKFNLCVQMLMQAFKH